MNKRIKSIIATVTVLVLGAFSLYAEEVNVNESKLTNLSYVKKTYKTKCKYKCVGEDGFYHYYFSSDRKAAFVKVKRPETELGSVVVKLGIVNVNDEVYGRAEFHLHGLTVTCNLHDAKCSVKGKLAAYLSEEDVEDMTKYLKDLVIEIALDLKGKN